MNRMKNITQTKYNDIYAALRENTFTFVDTESTQKYIQGLKKRIWHMSPLSNKTIT